MGGNVEDWFKIGAVTKSPLFTRSVPLLRLYHHPLMTGYHCRSYKGRFQLSDSSNMLTDNDLMCLNYLCVN